MTNPDCHYDAHHEVTPDNGNNDGKRFCDDGSTSVDKPYLPPCSSPSVPALGTHGAPSPAKKQELAAIEVLPAVATVRKANPATTIPEVLQNLKRCHGETGLPKRKKAKPATTIPEVLQNLKRCHGETGLPKRNM
jgi:hypothetical protein